jgi:hypothetical protein
MFLRAAMTISPLHVQGALVAAQTRSSMQLIGNLTGVVIMVIMTEPPVRAPGEAQVSS